jgi:putative MATE family efflux protein
MLTMIIGTACNIILDPIFIFGLKMGIRGAALATVISQFLSFAFLLVYFISGRSSLRIRFHHLKPDWTILRELFSLGVPVFVRQGGMSIVIIVVNNSLGYYGGDIYISIFGLIFRILHFVLMPLLGLVQGFQPITGFNYGAGNIERVKKTVKLALSAATILASFGFLALIFLTTPIFGIFSNDKELIQTGVPVLRLVVLIVPLIGLQMIGSSYFLAIGKAKPAFFLGLSRQFIFLLPLMIIMPPLLGVWGVFAAFPMADFISASVTGAWLFKDVKSLSVGAMGGR